jgi:hypothetical protein
MKTVREIEGLNWLNDKPEESSMDVVSPHSFEIDFDNVPELKPLPYALGKSKSPVAGRKLKQIDYYPKLEIEFFDVVKSCAEYIDKLNTVEDRLYYTKELNKIFVIRHKASLMQLFRKLVNLNNTGGSHG